MLFITTRHPLASARILSCAGVCTPMHHGCNPAGAVLVISDIWRCDGREILLPLMLDDSALRECDESRSARYIERHFG